VDAGDLLAVVGERKGESKLGDALRLLTGDDLERLNDAVDRLVLETRVFTLGVLTDDAEVDVLVACLVTRDVLEEDDRSVDVELLTEGNVEGTVAGSLDGSMKDTLETELVALERSNRFAEELLGVDVAGVDTRYVDLLPLNGNVVRLEDLLDRLGDLSTDTITCACSESISVLWAVIAHTRNQGNGVFAAELGGLEDVLCDRGHCCRPVRLSITRDILRSVRTSCSHGGCPSRGRLRAPQERLYRRISTTIFAITANCKRIGMSVPALFFERSSTTWWSCGVGLVVRDLR
jgi:hypothetical protein